MSTAAERAAQLELVARLKSAFPELPDAPTPDLLDHARITAYLKPVHDVGGEPDALGGQGGQAGQGGQGGGGLNVTLQQPSFQFTQIQTTVSVPDGGTVLLGGVKRLKEGRTMAGVPILNKIPYLSRLFKNTGVGRDAESVMLMVTPRIIIQEEEEELLGVEQ